MSNPEARHPYHLVEPSPWPAIGATAAFVTAFGDADPVTKGSEAWFQRSIPGAQGQPHVIIEGGGHFIQEDAGPQLAKIVLDVMSGQEES